MGPFKISTLVFMLAIFLVGEYAVVTFGPHPPDRRKQLVMQLPVVKQVRMWQYRQGIRQAFEEQGDSFSWTHKDSTHTWTNPDDLIGETRRGSRAAASAANQLINRARMRGDYPEFQRKARQGDIFGMLDYYFFAIRLGEKQDSTEARLMLEDHPSASAKAMLLFSDRQTKWYTRENRLIMAERARENLRHPNMSDANYRRSTEVHQMEMEQLRTQAEQGDADAQWVVEQLALRPVWQPAAR